MANSPKAEIEADVAEPLKAEVAALRADLADLGKHGRPHRQAARRRA